MRNQREAQHALCYLSVVRDVIPLKVRKAIYAGYVVLGVIVGALQAGYTVDPHWLDVAFAVLTYLFVPIGALALVNATPTTAPVVDVVPTSGPVDADGDGRDDSTGRFIKRLPESD